MDQKLQELLHSVSPRTAWIIIGSCAGFWLLCLTGVLTPPLSAPASITLFWFYAMLMLVLASGVAAIAAAAALVVRRRGRDRGDDADTEPPAAAEGPDVEVEQDDQDEVSDLGQLLDKPGRDDR